MNHFAVFQSLVASYPLKMHVTRRIAVVGFVMLISGCYLHWHVPGHPNTLTNMEKYKSWISRSLLWNYSCAQNVYMHTKKILYGRETFLNETLFRKDAHLQEVKHVVCMLILFDYCLNIV